MGARLQKRLEITPQVHWRDGRMDTIGLLGYWCDNLRIRHTTHRVEEYTVADRIRQITLSHVVLPLEQRSAMPRSLPAARSQLTETILLFVEVEGDRGDDDAADP